VRVAVIGATGNAGRHITRLLLEDPSTEVNACARSEARLLELEAVLVPTRGTLRTTVADVRCESDVHDIVSSADIVVGATSQSNHGPGLASLAVGCGASYYGVYLSDKEKWQRLRRLRDACLERGVMVVDDGGCHPGLPAAMVRFAAERGRLKEAWVGAKFGLRWDELVVARETIDDFLSEIEATEPAQFADRAWVRGYRHTREFDFGLGRGAESCMPMCIEEIRELVSSGTLESTGFFMAGFGPAVDYGVIPLSMGLAKVNRRWAAALLWWGLRRYASTTEVGVLVLDAQRASGGGSIRIRVSHPDPYVLTAAPAVATIRQMALDPRPGVWTQASFVEPADFFERIREMGIRVEA
jgi:hypothetical protein